MKKTISISKQKGKVLNLDVVHKQLDCLLNLSANGEYELSVSKRKSKRSLDQNALMWKWFSVIEDATGTSSQDVHDYYCKKFLKRIVSVGNHDEVVVGGTRNLNTAEMAEFLTKVQADVASEFGIVLPTSEDLYNNFI
jgi:hypothetical protein